MAKLETGVSKIYRYLSKQDHFTNPVKRFWTTMMNEELIHAKIFDEIRGKVKADDSIQLEISNRYGPTERICWYSPGKLLQRDDSITSFVYDMSEVVFLYFWSYMMLDTMNAFRIERVKNLKNVKQ